MKNTITPEEIEDYQFTKAQKEAVEALKKACARCNKVGLDLFGKQNTLTAYPAKFFKNDMVARWSNDNTYRLPYLDAGHLIDSGADDMEHFKDECVISNNPK